MGRLRSLGKEYRGGWAATAFSMQFSDRSAEAGGPKVRKPTRQGGRSLKTTDYERKKKKGFNLRTE